MKTCFQFLPPREPEPEPGWWGGLGAGPVNGSAGSALQPLPHLAIQSLLCALWQPQEALYYYYYYSAVKKKKKKKGQAFSCWV